MSKDEKPMITVPSADAMREDVHFEAGKRGQPERAFASATFFIPRPTHKRLKDYATEHSTTLQQILEEAVNEWLLSKNEPPFYPEGWPKKGKKDTL